MLQEMFGEESLPKDILGDRFIVKVDAKKAAVDLKTLRVECEEDEVLRKILQTAVTNLHQSLVPISV